MDVGIGTASIAQSVRESMVYGSSGGPVDVDATTLVMMALFLFLMVYFNRTLFQPYIATREQRGKRIQGAKKEAKEMKEEADAVFGRYERELGQALRQGAGERTKVREAAKAESAEILAEARTEIEGEMKVARTELEAQISKAAEASRKRAEVLADVIVEKVLSP